jgi:hypothetical protein
MLGIEALLASARAGGVGPFLASALSLFSREAGNEDEAAMKYLQMEERNPLVSHRLVGIVYSVER